MLYSTGTKEEGSDLMRLTLAEEEFMNGLCVLRERHGVGAIKVSFDIEDDNHVLRLYVPSNCDLLQDCRSLSSVVDLRVIYPLIHSAYIAISDERHGTYLWITSEGASAVQRCSKQAAGFGVTQLTG